MPFKLPSLSKRGHVMISLKLAKGLIEICELLLGVKYGLSGLTITEFANTTGGGNATAQTITITVTAPNGDTREYTVTYRIGGLPGNAKLKSLVVGGSSARIAALT